MIEKKLNPVTRGSYIVLAILAGLQVAVFAYLAMVGAKSLGAGVRGIFACAGLYSLVWLVLAVRTLRRGQFNARAQGNTIAWIAWLGVLLLFVGIVVTAPHAAKPIGALLALTSAVGFLIVGLAFLLGNSISQSTLQVREEMLRLELQIARLSERIDGTAPAKDESAKSS